MSAVLLRIMELQSKTDLSSTERQELDALQTRWSNHWIDPNECPRRLV